MVINVLDTKPSSLSITYSQTLCKFIIPIKMIDALCGLQRAILTSGKQLGVIKSSVYKFKSSCSPAFTLQSGFGPGVLVRGILPPQIMQVADSDQQEYQRTMIAKQMVGSPYLTQSPQSSFVRCRFACGDINIVFNLDQSKGTENGKGKSIQGRFIRFCYRWVPRIELDGARNEVWHRMA